MTTWWHGAGRIEGDMILPSFKTGMGRSGNNREVYITTERSLALMYASTVLGTAWLYEVEPTSEPVGVPSLVKEGEILSYSCDSARIIRRYTVSNQERLRARAAIRKAQKLADRL